ncbi:hypothetical protein WBP06_23235 [Novosphingobium sp. BL-8H]|uniref:hypothetical protein n=1 Tax=Novosphingobium sp. BL-8H TaxID=3127640 RepID=UPI00375811A0
MAEGMDLARMFVADYFDATGRADLSGMVLAGEGDDFPETRAAAELLSAQAGVVARYREALNQYADPGFWDDATPGGALALHDGGLMARNVLSGRPAFFHRD